MEDRTRTPSEQGRVARRRARVRADLLKAARQVFTTRGYQEATITEIIQLADVAMGTFYLHFQDKDAVLLALAEQGLVLLREHVHTAIEEQNDQPMIPLIIRTLLHAAYQQRDLFMLLCMQENYQLVHMHAHQARHGLAGHFIPVLQQARERGELSSDPVLIAHMLVGLLMRAINWWCQQDAPDPDEMGKQILAFLEHGLPPSLLMGSYSSKSAVQESEPG